MCIKTIMQHLDTQWVIKAQWSDFRPNVTILSAAVTIYRQIS